MNNLQKTTRIMKDSGIQWIGETPQEWRIGKVKDAFFRKNSKAQQENPTVLRLARSGIQVRDIENNEGQLAESYYNYNPVEVGDLLLNPMDLQSGANCNMSFVKGVISPAYTNLRAKEGFAPRYYDYYFKTQYWSYAFFAHGKGVSFENRWTLNNETLQKYRIPLPPFHEQQAIANYLDEQVGKIDTLLAEQKEAIEKWKAYKQSLISETVTKGLNPDAPMKDSGIEWIGEIPSGWNISKLRYLGACKNGISKGAEYFGYGFPFVSYGDIYRNIAVPNNVLGLIDSSDEERKLYSVQEGDIFFTRTSETKEEVGLTSVCLHTIHDAVFAGFVIRFRPIQGKLNKNFSKYYFRGEKHRVFFIKEMNVTTRASLGQGLLKDLPVLLPPLHEQQAIANFLDEKCAKIDESIEQKQALIKQLEEYKQSLIYECVTGKKQVI